MKAWATDKLGSLCLKVSSGGTPLRSISEYYENGTIPWLKTGEVKKGVIYDTEEKITGSGLENSSTKLIPANSVIVAMYGDGDTAGNVAINKIPLATNQACCNFTLNPEQAHYRFVYYYLKGSYNNLINLKSGGSQQNLNAYSLKSFPLTYPCVKVQEKIAAILSAYDELIENNQRRIALLEKMAEEIYREWFVRLRFPGHENVKNVKGIPEGWEIDRVDSIGKIVTGKTPSTDNPRYFGGPYFFIKTPDMHGNIFIVETEERLSQNGLDSQPSQTIPRGSICVSRIGTGGIVSITTSECQTNQQINSVIVRNPSDLEWAFFSLRNLREAIQMFGATGATMTNLSKGKFSSLKILRPNKSIVLKYHALVNPIFAQMQSILQQTMILRSTRDLLLPRLISGKLSVEQLDIRFPPGMEESAHVN